MRRKVVEGSGVSVGDDASSCLRERDRRLDTPAQSKPPDCTPPATVGEKWRLFVPTRALTVKLSTN